MNEDRVRPVRFHNRRGRRLQEQFRLALQTKVHRCEREELFEQMHAPKYRDFGRRVADADRARAIREADQHRFVGHDRSEVHIVDGRIVVTDGD